MRVKGYPWHASAEKDADAASSELECLFVFDDNKRAGTLERLLSTATMTTTATVTWTPVTFDVWEEEVWHFGLYDIVFERDARKRETNMVLCQLLMEITDQHDRIAQTSGTGSRGGKEGEAGPRTLELACTELHALVLTQHTCFLEWALRHAPADDLQRLDARPRDAPRYPFKSLPPLPPDDTVSYRHLCKIVAMLRDQNELRLAGDDTYDEIRKLQDIEERLKVHLSEQLRAAVQRIEEAEQRAEEVQLSADDVETLQELTELKLKLTDQQAAVGGRPQRATA